jgi:hypothetical protein
LQQRLFDHIDLRVRNRARAQEFFAQVLPAIGFALDKSAEEWGSFEKDGAGKPSEFFCFEEEANHRPMIRESHSGRRRANKSIASLKSSVKPAAKTWKAPRSGRNTAQVITRFSLKILTGINWRFAVAEAQSLRTDADRGNITGVSPGS